MSTTSHAPDGPALRIRYENTAEDRIAFARHVYGRSDAVRRARRKLTINLPLLIAVIFGALSFATRDLRYVVAAAVLAPAWALAVPRLFDRLLQRQLRAQLDQGNGDGLLGSHELELAGDELVERTGRQVQRTQLAAIDAIETGDGRTFILLGATARIIPHAAVTEGDRQAFVAALEQRLAESRA